MELSLITKITAMYGCYITRLIADYFNVHNCFRTPRCSDASAGVLCQSERPASIGFSDFGCFFTFKVISHCPPIFLRCFALISPRQARLLNAGATYGTHSQNKSQESHGHIPYVMECL